LVSTRSDLFSVAARYRPLNLLTLIGKYEFELRERSEVEEWLVLPEESEVHRINLTAHARPHKTIKLKAIYDYNGYDDPAYNTEPDHMSKLRLNATYTPVNWMTALFDYLFTVNSRDQLRYYNGRERKFYEQGERDGRRDHVLASLAFVVSPDATLTASWNYNRWKIEQDLTHTVSNSTAGPYYDKGVPYEDESNTWMVSFFYQLRKDLSFTADASYTEATGEYLSGVLAQDGTTTLGSFSEMDYKETAVSAELAKTILQDWEVGLQMRYGHFNDELNHSGPDHQDGELYVATVMVKRYF
jgi:hypothetical protein